MFIDSHCHLNDEKLLDRIDEVLSSAQETGVGLFLVVGWDMASSERAIEIAKKHRNVYAAIGFHPENLAGVSESDLLRIKAMAADPKVKAIGEIGLDYHWFKAPQDRINQKKWFTKQIHLANSLGLPVSIHAREASSDVLEILKANPVKAGGVLHCYSSSSEMIPEFAELGLYFGFDGPITYKNAVEPKRSVEACPIDRLLSETDSPYLSPVPFRGQVNEPKNIPLIVKEIALLKKLTVEETSARIERNFRNLFCVKQ